MLGMRALVVNLCVAAFGVMGFGVMGVYGQASHHEHEPAPERYARAVAAYAPPDVALVDQHGAAVSLHAVLGHDGPLMLQFIFTTCPAVCPVLSSIFSAAQEQLGPDLARVRLVSISIDPEHDTPARLHAYARQFKAGPQWHFLTGTRADVAAVQKAFDAYRGNKMRHPPLTFLRAAPGALWVRLDGFMSAQSLVAEYHRLMDR